MKFSGEDHVLAFGPYLSLGIWISMMWGQPMIRWYLQTILQ
jgi:leader peptidase (prepilin peptidase)/N-methyltransferase